jgi:hypothetical protein
VNRAKRPNLFPHLPPVCVIFCTTSRPLLLGQFATSVALGKAAFSCGLQSLLIWAFRPLGSGLLGHSHLLVHSAFQATCMGTVEFPLPRQPPVCLSTMLNQYQTRDLVLFFGSGGARGRTCASKVDKSCRLKL